MLHFIKTLIENPWKMSEDEKYEMLLKGVSKEVKPEELADIIGYIKSRQAIQVELSDAIDIAWTGWSWLPRINTSTLACLQLAQKWITIAKHGNNASSGRFGSFDLIEMLGYTIPKNEEEVLKEVEKNNVAFLHAKIFFPFFKEFAQVRKRYWKPTIFNILGPLLNPANTNFQIIGCSFEDKMECIIETCKVLWRKNVLVVRWEDWLDEVTLSWKTKFYQLRDWTITSGCITPEDFWFDTCRAEEIFADDISEKIQIAQKIISWEKVGKYSDLVDLNVKVALQLIQK